jgi:hypothetical protein
VTDSQRLATVKFATPESTGIPALPAEFWSRSLCLENIAGVVITASSVYNPNTNKGKIAIRAIDGLDKLKLKPRGNKESQKVAATASLKASPSSPIAADSQALQRAMQAPPASLPRKKNKKRKERAAKGDAVSSVSLSESVPTKSQRKTLEVSAVHVSPDKEMVTPIRPPAATETTPDSLGGPKGIAELLQSNKHKSVPTHAQPDNVAHSTENAGKKRTKEVMNDMCTDEDQRAPKMSRVEKSHLERLKQLKKEYQAKKSKTKSCGQLKPDQETAFYVSTTATIPIGRPQPPNEKFSDLDTAMVLAALKSPPKVQVSIVLSKASAQDPSSVLSRPDNAITFVNQKTEPKWKVQRERAAKANSKLTSPKPSSQSQAVREAFMREKVVEQYKQLRSYLINLTRKSTLILHTRNMRGPTLSSTETSTSTPQQKYSKLLEEHQAAHDSLQKRLLRSAETTLRLLLDDEIAADEARADLKASIKRFEEILYDTLHRQQMERDSLLAQHHGLQKTAGLNSTSGDPYPCQAAFSKLEEICAAITRPVGRPKTIVSPGSL